MIQPDDIPQINGDLEAVARYGQTLKAIGNEFADTGLDVHTTWQGLAAFYHAPEAGTLLAATAPVKTKTACIAYDLTAIGDALITYSDTVRPLQLRLASLRIVASAFRALVVDGNDDWNEDRHDVAENNRLITEVDAAVSQWQAAERVCANQINALFDGIHWVRDNVDGDHKDNEYGYSSHVYDEAAQHDGGPWGKAAEHDLIWWKDAWNDVVYFRQGSRQMGHDILTGAFDLVNFTDLPVFKSSWRNLYVLSLAMNPGPSPLVALNSVAPVLGVRQGELEQAREAAVKGFLSWDEWKENPAKAAGAVTINLVSLVLGPEDLVAGATATTVSDIAKLGSRSVEHLRPLASEVGRITREAAQASLNRILERVERFPSIKEIADRFEARLPSSDATSFSPHSSHSEGGETQPKEADSGTTATSDLEPSVPTKEHSTGDYSNGADPSGVDSPESRSPYTQSASSSASQSLRDPSPTYQKGESNGSHSPAPGAHEVANSNDVTSETGASNSDAATPQAEPREPAAPKHHGAAAVSQPDLRSDAESLLENWPKTPLEQIEPLPDHAGLKVEPGADGLISKVNDELLAQYLNELTTKRGRLYLRYQGKGVGVSRAKTGTVVSLVYDRLTGRIYEGANLQDPTRLHPVLGDRLDALSEAATKYPDRYYFGVSKVTGLPDIGGYPHFSKPGEHSEVKAVNQALWERERLGFLVTEDSLRSLVIDNIIPYGQRAGQHPPFCQNCGSILNGTNGLAGLRDPDEYLAPKYRGVQDE